MLSNPTISPPVLRERRLPIGRRESVDVVLVGHGREPGEHIFQVDERIDAVALAGDNDRINDRRALARVGMTDEEPVLFAQRRGPDGVFYAESPVMPRSRRGGFGFQLWLRKMDALLSIIMVGLGERVADRLEVFFVRG